MTLVKAILFYLWVSLSVLAAEEFKDPPLLATAKTLLSQLSEGKLSTRYSHDNVVEEKSLQVNCYGLINHIIKKSHPQALQNLIELMDILQDKGIKKSFDKQGLPSPENFFHIFKGLHDNSLNSTLWQGIKDISLLQPGDIIMYLEVGYQGDETREKQNHRTHIMLVSEVLISLSGVIKFKVIDSAHEVHNQVNDTRHLKGSKNGLGEATLVIRDSGKYVDGEEGIQIYNLFWDGSPKTSMERMVFGGRLLSYH